MSQHLDEHQFKEEDFEIRGRIVESVLSNCSEMLIIGTYWKTRCSMVSEQLSDEKPKLKRPKITRKLFR